MKNYGRKIYVKVIVFVLMIASSVGVIDSLGRLLGSGGTLEALGSETYAQSFRIANDMNDYIRHYMEYHFNLPTEREIANGDLAEEDLINALSNSYAEWSISSRDEFKIEYNKKTKKYTMQYTDGQDLINYDSSYDDPENYYSNRKPANYNLNMFLKQNPDIIERLTYQVQEDMLQRKAELKDWLAKEDYGIAVVQIDTSKNDNTKNIDSKIDEFKQYPIYYVLKNGLKDSNNEWLKSYSFTEGEGRAKYTKSTILFGMKQEHVDKMEREWSVSRANLIKYISYGLGYGVFVLICFIYLGVVIGKKEDSDIITWNWFDKVWTEVQLVVGGSIIIGSMAMGTGVLLTVIDNSAYTPFYSTCTIILTIIGATTLAAVLLSQVKRLKGHQFLDGFIGIRLLKKIGRGVIEIWKSGPRMIRMIVLVIVVILFSATVVGAFMILPFVVYFTYRYVKDFEFILDGAKKARDGQDNKIQTSTNGDLSDLADHINAISERTDCPSMNESQFDQKKSELIYNATNAMQEPLEVVSDYVKRLKIEECDNELALEYIDVIDEKTNQLKQISGKLFHVSETTIGKVDVNLEAIDFSAYLTHIIAEYEAKLDDSQLYLKMAMPEESVNIMADTMLLHQVLQIIMDNVLKHTLKNSRVYLSLEDNDQQAVLILKNVSAAVLSNAMPQLSNDDNEVVNFGLGLDIARNLIKLQQGIFEVVTDGDLFKIIIKFSK